MSEAVKHDGGLRTERRISHVFAMANENYHKPFFITDAAINITPDLLAKKEIVQNAIDLVLGISEQPIGPKVAILSAIETIQPAMQSTVDAACLRKMADRQQITGGVLEGPLAYDNPISRDAADVKGINSHVTGDADIFLTPDLEAGNMLAKQLILLGKASAGGIVFGARVPIVLTSRAADVEPRIGSCALAVLIVDASRASRLAPELRGHHWSGGRTPPDPEFGLFAVKLLIEASPIATRTGDSMTALLCALTTTTWSSCNTVKTVARRRESAGSPDKRADPIQLSRSLVHTSRSEWRNHQFDRLRLCQKRRLLICGACALSEKSSITCSNLVSYYPFRFVGQAPQRFMVRTERNSIRHA
jgi:hypothetical protein